MVDLYAIQLTENTSQYKKTTQEKIMPVNTPIKGNIPG